LNLSTTHESEGSNKFFHVLAIFGESPKTFWISDGSIKNDCVINHVVAAKSGEAGKNGF
jgi:hypothetical protein